MSVFMNAMEVSMGAGKHVGENGTPELDDLALPPALALSNALVRNVPRERLADLARRLVRSGADGVIDCALLVAHTRDARGGNAAAASAAAAGAAAAGATSRPPPGAR